METKGKEGSVIFIPWKIDYYQLQNCFSMTFDVTFNIISINQKNVITWVTTLAFRKCSKKMHTGYKASNEALLFYFN